MPDNALDERTEAAARVGVSCAHVVLGPKTRLGQSLIARIAARGDDVFAVARDEQDAAALAGCGATVVDGSLGVAADSLVIYVCALGPVHPGPAEASVDADHVLRDLALVQKILDSAPAASARVVLVSTVIALAPGDDRRYYGGWKCLVEEELRQLLAERSTPAELSVLYPGRLLGDDERTRPWHRLHTTYTKLSDLVEKAGHRPASSRVVGVDARVWLLTRGASLTFRSISGSRGALRRREAGPPPLVRDREGGRP
jgi:nucleoside-diphosphate-sugar epimerase